MAPVQGIDPDADKPPKAVKVDPPTPKTGPKPGTKSEPKSEPKTKPTGKTKTTRGRTPKLEDTLEQFFNQIALVVSAFNFEDGEVIRTNATTLAEAWGKLAREDERVAQAIDKLTKGSAWGGVLFSTGAVAVGIAANHGVLERFAPSMPPGVEVPMPSPPSPPSL